jgi:hypothetical protein
MPRKSMGGRPMTHAECQARCRAARAVGLPVARARRAIDRRSRAQRWRDAVAELTMLQSQYVAWLEALPSSLQVAPLPRHCRQPASSTLRIFRLPSPRAGSILRRDRIGDHRGDDVSSQERTPWPVATAANASDVGRYSVPTRVTAITSVTVLRRPAERPARQPSTLARRAREPGLLPRPGERRSGRGPAVAPSLVLARTNELASFVIETTCGTLV